MVRAAVMHPAIYGPFHRVCWPHSVDATATILLLATAVLGGLLGSLTGLGGGVVIVPVLVLLFKVDLPYAIGASLVAVVATSSGAAAAFVREGFTNVRVAMVLEVATVAGALLGAAIATWMSRDVVAVVFGLVAIWSAWGAAKAPRPLPAVVVQDPEGPRPLAERLRLASTYPTPEGPVAYSVFRVPAAFATMIAAGVLSALIGVGSGFVKVIAMDRIMRLPFKVSTTTSNFMIGVTASASAGVYLHRGQLLPALCGPVALGALLGSLLGARLLPKVKVRPLRLLFAVVVAIAGVQMIMRAFTGSMESVPEAGN